MCQKIQTELDTFFVNLQQSSDLVRHVTEQAFAQARSKLSLQTIPSRQKETHGF